MKKSWIRFAVFLFINFGALGIGGLLMGEGPQSVWYQSANQAPWTPPGWVFGFAWFSIMLCFSIYLTVLFKVWSPKLFNFFLVLTAVNILWNPLFFMLHDVNLALVVISALTLLVAIFLLINLRQIRVWTLLLLPYLIWLIIATSLNAFIVLNN